jgi:hypothetical protein
MTNRQENPTPRENLLVVAVFIISLILVALCAAGCCTTKVVEHIVHQRDTTYIERQKVDSLYRRDSVFVREKGDTVYIYKEKIRDRYRYIHDTVRLVKIDTVQAVKEVPVAQPLTLGEQVRLRAFWGLLCGFLLLLLWTFRKPLIKLLKI